MKKILLVIIAVLVMLLASFFAGIIPLDLFGDDSYHTGISPGDINHSETKHNEWGCGLGSCWWGNIVEDYTELIMDDANNPIVTSFKPYGNEGQNDIGLSETITVYGTITIAGNGLYYWAPNTGYYKVSIKEGGSWKVIIWDGGIDEDYVYKMSGTVNVQQWEVGWISPSNTFDISPLSFKLKGAHVGAIHVEVVTDFVAGVVLHETHITSEDWCYVISGEGSINIAGYAPHQVPMFEVGENVPIEVSADYSGYTTTGDGRWELRYFSHGTGKSGTINTWNQDWIRTTYNWNMPDDLWYRGISDSKITIELWNTLFPQEAVMINNIDLKANAPPSPSIVSSDFDPFVGDSINVFGSCDTNTNTNERIETFHVRAVYSDNNQEIGYWTNIIPTGQDPSSYVCSIINLPRAGTLKVQVWAHDVAGRESVVPGTATITVHDKGAGEYFDLVKAIIAFVIAVIFIVGAFFAPLPAYAKPVIAIAGIVIAVLFYLFY